MFLLHALLLVVSNSPAVLDLGVPDPAPWVRCGPNWRAKVSASTVSGRPGGVRVRWSYHPSPLFDSPSKHQHIQDVEAGWDVTALAEAGSGQVLVGGLDAEETVIEAWTLRAPFERAPRLTNQEVQRRPVLRLSLEDQCLGAPKLLLWNRAAFRHEAFVMFTLEASVYRLDLESGALHVLFAEADYPALRDARYDWPSSGDHLVEGYVYSFSRFGRLHMEPSLNWVDTDRDGVIDEAWLFQAGRNQPPARYDGDMLLWYELQGLLIHPR